MYSVQKILDKKVDTKTNTQLYLVKWQGYDVSYSSWEPYQHLEENCSDLVEKFEQEYGQYKTTRMGKVVVNGKNDSTASTLSNNNNNTELQKLKNTIKIKKQQKNNNNQWVNRNRPVKIRTSMLRPQRQTLSLIIKQSKNMAQAIIDENDQQSKGVIQQINGDCVSHDNHESNNVNRQENKKINNYKIEGQSYEPNQQQAKNQAYKQIKQQGKQQNKANPQKNINDWPQWKQKNSQYLHRRSSIDKWSFNSKFNVVNHTSINTKQKQQAINSHKKREIQRQFQSNTLKQFTPIILQKAPSTPNIKPVNGMPKEIQSNSIMCDSKIQNKNGIRKQQIQKLIQSVKVFNTEDAQKKKQTSNDKGNGCVFQPFILQRSFRQKNRNRAKDNQSIICFALNKKNKQKNKTHIYKKMNDRNSLDQMNKIVVSKIDQIAEQSSSVNISNASYGYGIQNKAQQPILDNVIVVEDNHQIGTNTEPIQNVDNVKDMWDIDIIGMRKKKGNSYYQFYVKYRQSGIKSWKSHDFIYENYSKQLCKFYQKYISLQ